MGDSGTGTTLPGQLALPTQPVKKDSQLRVLPGTTWQHIFEAERG